MPIFGVKGFFRRHDLDGIVPIDTGKDLYER